MVRRAMVWCLLCLTPVSVWCADLPTPPSQQVLRRDSSGQWQMLMQVMVCKLETRTGTVTKKVPETKTVTEVIDGKTVEKAVTIYRDVTETYAYTVSIPDYHTKAISIDVASIKVFETDGRRIPTEKLSSRVTGETLVVVSPTDTMIPDAYASLFKPGTMILTTPVVQPALPARPLPAATVAPPPTPTPVAAPSPAAKLPELPKSPAPLVVSVSREGTEKLLLRRLSESTAPVTGMQTFKKGTTKEKAPVPMTQTVRLIESFAVSGKHLRFAMNEAKDLPLERMKERLAREVPAIYTADGDDIDPFWLQNLKSSTLVVTGPQLPGGCGPMAPTSYVSPPMVMPQVAPNAPVTPAPGIAVPVPTAPVPQPRKS